MADSGTTKCDWIFIDDKQHDKHFELNTVGLNPTYHTDNEIIGIINNNNDFLSIKSHVERIYFFGSGCGQKDICQKMEAILSKVFYNSKTVHVSGDIEGAVYACTDSPGVVSILGTGSHCCYFDGKNIEIRVPSLGYIVSDDGGGNRIGRSCIRSYYYGQMDTSLASQLEEKFEVSPEYIKDQLYKKHNASRYMASFAPFVFENMADEKMHRIIHDEIESFFNTHLMVYKEELKDCPLHFVGSIAYHAKEIIEELCKKHGFKLGQLMQRPVNGLAERIDTIEHFYK